jgi:hypothetical protein
VSIEETEEGDRFDIFLDGFGRPIVIEAKVDLQERMTQIVRYSRAVKRRTGFWPRLVILDRLSAQRWSRDELERLPGEVLIVTWADVARLALIVGKSASCHRLDPGAAAIALHLADHLRENGMSESARKEVYCRDLGSAESVELYFRHNIYNCQPKFLNSATGCLYFAPYFSRRALTEVDSTSFVPISEGISYISSIQTMQVVPGRELRDYLREQGVTDPRGIASLIGRGTQLVIMLGPPRQLLLTPVTKRQLGFPGTMGSKVLTLGRLLEASRV